MYKYSIALLISAGMAVGIYVIVFKYESLSAKRLRQPKIVKQPTSVERHPMQETKKNEFVTLDSGLKYKVLKEGTGAHAKNGDVATVHYTGWLYDEQAPEFKGKKFDSSVDRGQPFQFDIGSGMVIRGWDEGVALMKEGEKRTFILPPELAYGSNAVGGVIPANATLIFDVELLKLN